MDTDTCIWNLVDSQIMMGDHSQIFWLGLPRSRLLGLWLAMNLHLSTDYGHVESTSLQELKINCWTNIDVLTGLLIWRILQNANEQSWSIYSWHRLSYISPLFLFYNAASEDCISCESSINNGCWISMLPIHFNY